ncbi:MAG: putative transporter [Firmicutes bacterium ADurb.Bin300]|nr:MAG: putative transporter [Firmicutes bacterium ADurb.Bin300]
MAKKLKLNYGKTILIGFGFMASSVAWGIYDPYVTTILNNLLSKSATIAAWGVAIVERFPKILDFLSATGEEVGTVAGGFTLVPLFIGLIMTFDNIFGVIFQPTFGKLSDRCHSRFGKRRPFVFFGAPISALFFILIPRMSTIPALMFCIIMYVFIMSLWRAPVVALMPDLTAPSLRSEGNAVINLMGGIGGLLATLAASIVCLIGGFNKDTDAESYIPWVFVFGAVIMIAATVILFFFVKEPDSRLKILSEERQANDEKARLKAAKEASKVEKARLKAIKLSKGERKSLIFMLIGLFFLFCGANAVQTFFALFASEILNKNVGQATTMLFMFVVASAISAVPAGYLGKKLGRKKTILIGLTAFLAAFLAYLAVQLITGKGIALVWVALIVGGAANMLITVNTLPLVLEIGGVEKIGTFTGYYYTATFSAQIATPIIYGTVRMLSGTYMSLFVYCPICFIISFLSIMLVRHGESIPEDILKKAQQEDL